MENPSKTRQYITKNWMRWAVPIVLSVWVTVMTYFHEWIETAYSAQFYPYIGRFQRVVLGWLPFSLGDILYFVLGLWLTIKVVKTIIAAVRRRITRHKTIRRTFRLARLLLWTYIVFSLLWGWNYHRLGLDYQLQLPTGKYTSAEVQQLMDELVIQLNENRLSISKDSTLPQPRFAELRNAAVETYRVAAIKFPFLHYPAVSMKQSMYSSVAKYFGFTGYYNPFTGEAQLSSAIPEVMKPFILCHEIGHQVGYAKENEASFAGYLAASSSNDPYFRYSVYLDLYSSVRAKLVHTKFSEGDTAVTTLLQQYNRKLDTLVRFDRRKIREFFQQNNNAVSEQMSAVVLGMYEQYLKANSQTAGLKSYDDVASLLIAYKRKFGRI